MERAEGTTNVIRIDDCLHSRFQKLVQACRVDLHLGLPDCMLRHDPFAVAVAVGDHFVEQLNDLILKGKYSPEEAMQYAMGVLTPAELTMPNEAQCSVASRANRADPG